jgi:hypothetical protein
MPPVHVDCLKDDYQDVRVLTLLERLSSSRGYANHTFKDANGRCAVAKALMWRQSSSAAGLTLGILVLDELLVSGHRHPVACLVFRMAPMT